MDKPTALDTSMIKITVTRADRMFLDHHARAAGQSVPDYLRVKAGLRPRPLGRPTLDQVDDMADDAWSLLRSIGVDPEPYFPAAPPQGTEEDRTPEQIARLRAIAKQAPVEDGRRKAESAVAPDPYYGNETPEQRADRLAVIRAIAKAPDEETRRRIIEEADAKKVKRALEVATAG